MSPEDIRKYATPVPRYTSYPTANHFSPAVDARQHAAWLAEVPADADLSLYLHIPFCRELCWYCACNTKATRRDEPVTRYLTALEAEIAHVAERLGGRRAASHIHFGGGSPSLLSAPAIRRLGTLLRDKFDIAPEAEIAIELDPRDATPEQADAFAGIGVTRVSLGVQDFDPRVQAAINRVQSFDTTRHAIGLFRERGVGSLNIDLVYGLPHQTEDSLRQTIARVSELAPDRLAVFGYAHLPARVPHQRLIDEAAMPDAVARHAQSKLIARLIGEAGYVTVGLDHYAKPTDSLATGAIQRNFQGYTTDAAGTLIGFGASAISSFPGGYSQNAVAAHEYERRVGDQGLATARGIRLEADDRMRAFVIERLMCDLTFSRRALEARFGLASAPLVALARSVIDADADGLVRATDDGFVMTERGKPLVRTVCAKFDAYLDPAHTRHALAV